MAKTMSKRVRRFERKPVRTDYGSILAPDGRVMFFSAERFARNICKGRCCFICGVDRQSAKFNNEHILPNWLFQKYKLHGESITLPTARPSPAAIIRTYSGAHLIVVR
jgi:hypothetical protein